MFFKKENETLDLLENYANKKDYKKSAPQEQIFCRDSGKINIEKEHKPYFLPPIIMFGIMAFIVLIIILNNQKNPLIGKWKSITPNFMGYAEIEFTDKRMFMLGMVGDVKYEQDGDKVIVFDKSGLLKDIGSVYIIKDKNTIESNSLGIKTFYKRVE